MISGLQNWLKTNDYNYIECNYVPPHLFVRNHKVNMILRTFFRLCPFNMRSMKRNNGELYPLTPQSNVTLLKAYSLLEDISVLQKIYPRISSLRSANTQYFSLKQGIKIAVNLYENSSEDPTPLNTVWFGQFLLEDNSGIVSSSEKKDLLFSISHYLVDELGYVDHGEEGVYFYYGPTLVKEIYNASALMSAFLLKVGHLYSEKRFIELGEKGIRYILNKQNVEGSWFYAGAPERPTIDSFHQSYILQALCSAQPYLDYDITKNIENGVNFYKTLLFKKNTNDIYPVRYDKRFKPKNTWLFVKTDGRDISEGLVFFSKYWPDKKILNGLLEYTYKTFFDKRRGVMYPEIFIYGKNRIPYIEFQAWFLYALILVKKSKIL